MALKTFSNWLAEQAPVIAQPGQMPTAAGPVRQPAGQAQIAPPAQQNPQARQMYLKQLQTALGPFQQAMNGLQDPALKQQISGLFMQFQQGLGQIR